ncbi:MAG: MFS transporter [Rhodospirillales bacterium]
MAGWAPLALLGDGAYRRVWTIGALTWLTRASDIVVTGIYVFDVTGSAGAVALVAFLRFLPMVAGAVSGALAARAPLALALRGLLATVALVYAVLAALAPPGLLQLWHVGLGAFLIGLYWSAENSVRRTLLGEIAGHERISAAIGLDWAAINAVRLVGPLAGAAIYAQWGMGAWFGACALAYAAAAVLALRLELPAAEPPAHGLHLLTGLAEDLRAALVHPITAGILAVTVCMNLFTFPYISMVPVIGKETLDAAPVQVGMMATVESLGAVLGGVAVANIVRPRLFGPLFLLGSLTTTLGGLALGLSGAYALSLAALFVAGLGVAFFATMQSTMMLTFALPERRARMMGMLTSAIGLGQSGVIALGAVAGWLGTGNAVALFSATGLALLVVCAWRWPAMWRTSGA